MKYADAKAQVAGTLEQAPIPTQCDVVGDAPAGSGIIHPQGALFGVLRDDLGRLAQRRPATLALHVVADRLQFPQQAVQSGDGELDGISHGGGTRTR
ncbi:hypothetical protein D9M68_894840 [compost metagenome]